MLTPGVYNLNAPIIVSRPDTVVLGLGLGFATQVPQKGNAALVVLPNKGVKGLRPSDGVSPLVEVVVALDRQGADGAHAPP